MTQIRLDASLAGQLQRTATLVELCDPSGNVVGHFTPVKVSKIPVPFSEEDIQRSKQKTGARPLADILADLEKS
jgi:hypothetical protein